MLKPAQKKLLLRLAQLKTGSKTLPTPKLKQKRLKLTCTMLKLLLKRHVHTLTT